MGAGKMGVDAWLVVAGLTSAWAALGTPEEGAGAVATAEAAGLAAVAAALAEGGACVDAAPNVVGLTRGVEAGAGVAATDEVVAVDAAGVGVVDVAAVDAAGFAALTGRTAAVV